MNKHLLSALWAWTHPTLIQTLDQQTDGDTAAMALDIRLLDRDENGNGTDACDTRYVRISDSSKGDAVYPLCLQNGEAYLRLEDCSSAQYTLVQCDENGNRLINGDAFAITYTINDQLQQEEDARIFKECGSFQQVEIINMPIKPVTLHIVKTLENEFGEALDFHNDMCFSVSVKGCGICEEVTLSMENQFHAVLEHLPAGMYEIKERSQEGYRSRYQFNGEELCDQSVFLTCGTHTLTIVNQRYTGSVLTIDKYIRCENGELIKPQNDACFHVQVISDRYEECFVLNKENDFSVELCDLPQGCYDIKEVNECARQVSYIVNEGKESDYASVEIARCSKASVLIINRLTTGLQESPLRICKYVRGNDGCLRKPDAAENFKVMLSGCGVCEIFNLNVHNNFCVDIEHICCGEYEVRELNHDGYVASYIVNDGCESTAAALWIHENGTNCVTIINEKRNQGRLTISKVIRQNDGSLVKPDKRERFIVTLRSIFARESYVLDAENDFCVHIQHLKEGSYEVKERCVNGYDTTYTVNGASESKKARFVITNHASVDIKVINSMKKTICGDLRICKYIADSYGNYVKPGADEEFKIHVEGNAFDEWYMLRSANSWCIILEGLKRGSYRISEQADTHYDTRYFVNDCECREALVSLDHQNQAVTIVNTPRSNGNLKLNIMVQDCSGSLRKPNQSEFFEVILETGEGSSQLRFDARNNFGMLLEDLPYGKARITQKDNYGYRVIYEVNGSQCNHAAVMMEGASATVTIINQIMDCSGMVRVRKLVRTLNNRLITPCDEDCYEFTLRSRCLDQQYTLNEQNHFCVLFDDLEQGEYELKESHVCGMKTSYRINGKESDQGVFTLSKEDITIDIINTVLPLPKLNIQKRIRKHGCLSKPQKHEVFHFQLIGKGVHETYCLNKENDWCITLEDLCSQHYEIRELNVKGNVCYQINDTVFEQGTFLFDDQDMDITIINDAGSDALVRIAKMMTDQNNEACKPCRGDQFEIVLESDCFKQCFTLDERNDWCVEVEGLPEGIYTVKEQNNESYDVIINNCKELNHEFELKDDDVDIVIYNQLGCANVLKLQAYQLMNEKRSLPDASRVYHVNVAHDGVCDHFCLNHENDWSIQLCDIVLGEYHIYSDEAMLYEACGEWFENSIQIEMGCGEMTVNLFEKVTARRDIIITKRLMDAQGKEQRPNHEDCFEVMLISHREESFTLNRENDWCIRLCDYPCGSYEVIEVNNSQARYRINHQEPSQRGLFVLKEEPVQVTILNPACDPNEEESGGRLVVAAFVKNCEGLLETPPLSDHFSVLLDGEQVVEDIVLSERNGFQRRFDFLPCQTYTLTASKQDPYTHVMYRINGKETAAAVIELKDQPIQVDVIYYKNCAKGSIHVMKYIKEESCGCLKRPHQGESFDITLQGEDRKETVILNASNQWHYLFDDLAVGTYTLWEAGNEATYIVNGGKEQTQAIIAVNGDTGNVKVINTRKQDGLGSIELCKYVRDENGQDHNPDGKQQYWISVKGNGEIQHVLLHEANHFYAQLTHLPAGVYEVSEDEGEHVVYSVNGGSESDQARVEVAGNHNSVDIINTISLNGSITIQKMLRQQDQTLMLPSHGSYRVHISAPGYNQVVVLDETNQYRVVLTDLRHGLYVVDELDHEDVSYIIDQGTLVDRAIVNVRGSHDVVIINPIAEAASGSFTLTKYLRDANGILTLPPRTASYRFHIRSRDFHEQIELNEANRWSATLMNLKNGSYTINEATNDAVRYVINDAPEQAEGIVTIANNHNQVAAINEQTVNRGRITIVKYLRDNDNQLVKPSGDYQVSVHISKAGYNETVVLNQANDWQTEIDELANGDYVLTEINHNDEVTWQIDHGYEVRYAVVSVRNDAHQVAMINHPVQQGTNTVRIQKQIRSEDGQLSKPQPSQSFTLSLQGAQKQRITLDAGNNWSVQLNDLSDGVYELTEESAGYQVSYRIDEGEERANALFVLQNSEVGIQVINSQLNTSGRLDLTAFVKNSNGAIMLPVSGDQFKVNVSSSELTRTYTLNEDNRFTVRISDLPDNTYQIRQLAPEDSRVTYRVNGGAESDTATVTVKAGVNNVVALINANEDNRNSVHVYKYMMDAQGNYRKPDSNQIFRFLLSGNNVHQFYTLSNANDWHVQIDTLSNGEYEIMEQGSGDYDVKYQINGSAMMPTAVWTVTSGSETNIGIINIDSNPQNGVINLEKKLRDENGNLVIPGNGEGFMIRVWSTMNGYDEIFTLDELNGYTLRIDSLRYGEYQIEEVDTTDYGVTYQVNAEAETTQAKLMIDTAGENQVLIINTQVALFYRLDDSDDLRIVIE